MAAGSPESVHVEEDAANGGAGVVRYAHTLRTGRHTLRGDLMPAAGGGDAGPSPKELAMLSLGLCTSMTVRMFADASRFPLEHVSCRVRENTRPGEHTPQGLELELHLVGPQLTEAQRARLLRAAANCPVKKMLSGNMPEGIASRLAS